MSGVGSVPRRAEAGNPRYAAAALEAASSDASEGVKAAALADTEVVARAPGWRRRAAAVAALIGAAALVGAVAVASSSHGGGAAGGASAAQQQLQVAATITTAPSRTTSPSVAAPSRTAAPSSPAPALLNPAFTSSAVSTSKVAGEFVLTGFVDGATPPAQGWPVVLVYHGGGSSAAEVLGYTGLAQLHAIVIALQGQSSYNGRAWLNAFPWLKDPPRNDMALTEAALEMAARSYPLDRSRIFATGKSDGGGMAVFIAAHPEMRNFDLAGAAPVAGAYFGASTDVGYTPFAMPASATQYRNLALAPRAVPLLVMHGTMDRVMEFAGGRFSTPKALDRFDSAGAFWGRASGFATADAFHAPIESYWSSWARVVNGASRTDTRDLSRSATQRASLVQHSACGKLPLSLLVIEGADHSWFGHRSSGPGAATEAGLMVDATRIMAAFFEISLSEQYATDVAPDAPRDALNGTTYRTLGSCTAPA